MTHNWSTVELEADNGYRQACHKLTELQQQNFEPRPHPRARWELDMTGADCLPASGDQMLEIKKKHF